MTRQTGSRTRDRSALSAAAVAAVPAGVLAGPVTITNTTTGPATVAAAVRADLSVPSALTAGGLATACPVISVTPSARGFSATATATVCDGSAAQQSFLGSWEGG